MSVRLVSPAYIPFVGILLLCSCTKQPPQEASHQVYKVTAKELNDKPNKITLHYSGSIDPDNTAQIGFSVPGVVKNILVEEGQHVSQGQLLATIDATELSNALSIASSGLEQAEDMFTRLDGLYKKGSLPEKDYIDIKTKLAQAKANKNISEKRLADSKLYSPISGIITGKMIERGSTAAPGVPAFTIVKTDKVYAKVAVPESEVGLLKPGIEAAVYIPTLAKTFPGHVAIIIPQADVISRTYTVKVRLDNRTGQILPGMLTETTVHTGKTTQNIQIPSSSILLDANGVSYVFVASNAGKAIRKRVTVGDVAGDNEVVVKEGLATGDKLIIAGHTRLKDGSTISY